ncbi:MAG: LOG family protein [Anaerolineae bacterium]|nr:LOG family protein [Anaerolineae bacterium]
MEKLIIVYGSSRTEEEKHLRDAEELGRRLAQAGYGVGTGGYTAIMDAASKGAYQAGGHVIAYPTDEFPDLPPTQWHHEERRTPDLHLRIQAMLRDGDAFIAMWGGIGTLAEVAVTWNVAQFTATMGRPVKPMLLLGAHWKDFVANLSRSTDMSHALLTYPIIVESPAEAIAMLQKEIGNQ